MQPFFVLLLLGSVSSAYIDRNRPDEGAEWEDTSLQPVELIQKYKYPAEEYNVTTSDGYILRVFRIPYGRLCPEKKRKGTVILFHGLFTNCYDFISIGTKRGLGYVLADSCYDVWMPNVRGTPPSMTHVKYNESDFEYWDFSWHEIGIRDFPAAFDFILNKTRSKDVICIGHSEGATSFLVFNILRPEYTAKVRAAFLLGPMAFMGNIQSPLVHQSAMLASLFKKFFDSQHIYCQLQKNDPFNKMISFLSKKMGKNAAIISQNSYFTVIGFDNKQTNTTLTSMLLRRNLLGGSNKEITHYAQLITSGKFQQYDYGDKNMDVYGQSTPPEYDLSQAKSPIHLFTGANDGLADLEDVLKLAKKLPNCKELYVVPYFNFNHEDHIYAKDILELEYDHLVEQIDSYYK